MNKFLKYYIYILLIQKLMKNGLRLRYLRQIQSAIKLYQWYIYKLNKTDLYNLPLNTVGGLVQTYASQLPIFSKKYMFRVSRNKRKKRLVLVKNYIFKTRRLNEYIRWVRLYLYKVFYRHLYFRLSILLSDLYILKKKSRLNKLKKNLLNSGPQSSKNFLGVL